MFLEQKAVQKTGQRAASIILKTALAQFWAKGVMESDFCFTGLLDNLGIKTNSKWEQR